MSYHEYTFATTQYPHLDAFSFGGSSVFAVGNSQQAEPESDRVSLESHQTIVTMDPWMDSLSNVRLPTIQLPEEVGIRPDQVMTNDFFSPHSRGKTWDSQANVHQRLTSGDTLNSTGLPLVHKTSWSSSLSSLGAHLNQVLGKEEEGHVFHDVPGSHTRTTTRETIQTQASTITFTSEDLDVNTKKKRVRIPTQRRRETNAQASRRSRARKRAEWDKLKRDLQRYKDVYDKVHGLIQAPIQDAEFKERLSHVVTEFEEQIHQEEDEV